jgi:iron complex outermembrane receptor protein
LLSKYVGKQYLDNTSSDDRIIEAYFTNDLRAKWDLNPSWIKGLSLTLLVNNIFNKMYSSNGYTYGYIAGSHIQENFYYPQAGRNFLAGVNIRF